MRNEFICDIFASISISQVSSVGAELQIGSATATLLNRGEVVATWPVTRIDTLTTGDVGRLVDGGGLVFAHRASNEALRQLREASVSYATAAEEWYLIDPPSVFVVQPAQRNVDAPRANAVRFSRGALRIAKQLLLDRGHHPTIGDLAEATNGSSTGASRAVQELAERRFVTVAPGVSDSRRRLVTVNDPSLLLDALADDDSRRSTRSATWDIGARSATDAVRHVAEVGSRELRYAVSGLAGVHALNPFVQASTVAVWIPKDEYAGWQEQLMAVAAKPAAGRVVVRLARDPWMFERAELRGGVVVADLVQLFMDCRNADERALEAAALVRDQLLAV